MRLDILSNVKTFTATCHSSDSVNKTEEFLFIIKIY